MCPHELKTPLMSISGYAEIIEHGMVRHGGYQQLCRTDSCEEGQPARCLIWWRISSVCHGWMRRMEACPQRPTDLPRDLRRGKKTSGYCAPKTGEFSLPLRGKERVPWMECVRFSMRWFTTSAITLSSTIKRAASVKLSLKMDQGDPVLAVEDTGIGIAPEEQARREFLKDFTGWTKSHSKETGGTGLGLSIVKTREALLHHGKIQVDSTPGAGHQD